MLLYVILCCSGDADALVLTAAVQILEALVDKMPPDVSREIWRM